MPSSAATRAETKPQTKRTRRTAVRISVDRAKLPGTIQKTNAAIDEELAEFERLSDGCPCYAFMSSGSVSASLVDDVFADLRRRFGGANDRLIVVIYSSGGDINAAYNLALLFRRYGAKELTFVVPRWAKSAATLVVTAGDRILMSPVAELGPLDPQITAFNPLENRLESFSPLHIDATLDLIREEFKRGGKQLAEGLMRRLQFPLTLGSFKKSLDIAEVYVQRLLAGRMLDGDEEGAKRIATRLARGYSDHGYVINIDEARELGLKVDELDGPALDRVWRVHELDAHRRELNRQKRQKENEQILKRLPPDLLDTLRNHPVQDGVIEVSDERP